MKKLALVTLMLVLTAAMVLGCTKQTSTPAPTTPETTEAPSAAPATPSKFGGRVPEFEPQGGEYGKYFVRGPKAGGWVMPTISEVLQLDADIVPETDMYFYFSFLAPGYGDIGSHGPHTHPCWEVLGFFSAYPNDPYNLDAEIVLYMGEEMEPHTITQSTIVYIPPNTPHCPLVYEKMGRPIVFLYAMGSPVVQETSRRDLEALIPEKHRAGVFYPHDMPFPMPQQTVKSEAAKWACPACPYVYDPAVGDPKGGIAPGTPFEEIPDDWVCPICGLSKSKFQKIE